ncbi:hypothetical protein BH23PLA1_BH23PLA1_15470 [soil metagenome]
MFLLLRHRRGPGGLARRKARPGLLALEERRLLSGLGIEPTADEQYMLELINRTRSDPAAEARRLVELAQSDSVLQFATRNWDIDRFSEVLSSYAPRAPLAFNPRLIGAARDHNEVMLSRNNQFHAPRGYLTNPSVAQAADGQAYLPTVGEHSWATGENVFAYSRNVRRPETRDYVDYYHAGFLIDWGNPNFGHLRNLMAPGPSTYLADGRAPFSEIGIGLRTQAEPTVPTEPGSQGAAVRLDVGPVIATQEFGWRHGRAFLTGTFYNDLDGDAFYTPGEGLGGVTIHAQGQAGEGVYQTQTWASGGYSLELPVGTYTVSATGNLPASWTTVVTIGLDNVGWGQRIVPNVSVPTDGPPTTPDPSLPRPTSPTNLTPTPTPTPNVPELNPPVRIASSGRADLPVPADYNGNGRVDLATFQPETAGFFVRGASASNRVSTSGLLTDIPLPGDFDGDGQADFALFRPSTAEWIIQGSLGETRTFSFGAPGLDMPVPADYDGDGITDVAVYRPSTAEWFLLRSRDGVLVTTFGAPNLDVPVPADYDGDGRADLALFRPNTAEWLILGSREGARLQVFGEGGDARRSVASVLSTNVSDYGPIAARLSAQTPAPAPASEQEGRPATAPPVASRTPTRPTSTPLPVRLRPAQVERVLQFLNQADRPALNRFLDRENAPMAGRWAILRQLLH